MSHDFLLGILPTILFTTITVWSGFESQDKRTEARRYLVFGIVAAFFYSLFLVAYYGFSVMALLSGMWIWLSGYTKWWQIILLLVIVFMANLISRRGIKIMKVEGEKEEEEKKPISTRKGKELPKFEWMGGKEDRVGKGGI